MITPIPSYYTTVIWPKVRQLLIPAIEGVDSGFKEEDILKRLQVANMQLWVVNEYEAAAVTQVQQYPQFKSALIVALGGENMNEWLDEFIETVEKWASEIGCAYMEEYGRKGWERVGKPRGWEPLYTVMRKAVNG